MNNITTVKIPRELLARFNAIRRKKAAKDDRDTNQYDVLLEMVEVAEKKYGVKDKK